MTEYAHDAEKYLHAVATYGYTNISGSGDRVNHLTSLGSFYQRGRVIPGSTNSGAAASKTAALRRGGAATCLAARLHPSGWRTAHAKNRAPSAPRKYQRAGAVAAAAGGGGGRVAKRPQGMCRGAP